MEGGICAARTARVWRGVQVLAMTSQGGPADAALPWLLQRGERRGVLLLRAANWCSALCPVEGKGS